ELTHTNRRRSAAWLLDHFRRPQAVVPGTSMPPVQLSDAQLNALAAFLLKLNEKNAEALRSAPQFALDGAIIYQQHRCGVCHQVNGFGMKHGPALNGLAQRRSREWIEEHFRDPQKLSPGTSMPPYRFSSRETDRVTSYLLSLP
ncbi:MAG TPA: c-type cytochrome, partial [Bryobacteraceae bacterium]|nr:c-type cytochrome [Bryobacteraceae bacterium]